MLERSGIWDQGLIYTDIALVMLLSKKQAMIKTIVFGAYFYHLKMFKWEHSPARQCLQMKNKKEKRISWPRAMVNVTVKYLSYTVSWNIIEGNESIYRY